MNALFDPSPAILAWLVTRKFVWAEVILILAIARLVLGPGPARWAALGAVIIAGGVTATIFAPVVGIASGPGYTLAVAITNHAQGLSVLLLASLLLLCAFAVRFRPVPRIELVALIMTLGGLGLWTATLI